MPSQFNPGRKLPRILFLAACATSTQILAPLAAQAAVWTQVATTGPSARYGHAMAHDSQRGRTVLFGGNTASGSSLGDTWEWDGGSWVQVAGTGPAARSGSAMAYDAHRGRSVLFGGYDNGSPLGDTWEWDGGSWVQVAGTGPAARSGSAMAYDSQRGRAVLVGGTNSLPFADTWEWDGNNWMQVIVTGPVARSGHSLAYDSQRGRTVLFGGSNGSSLGDTWEWNGTNWLPQVFASGPPAGPFGSMAYDSQRGRTVQFDGLSTWEWDGGSWMQIAGAGPSARYLHAMAYDSQRGRTVMFGGAYGFPLADTWERDGAASSIAATAVTFGTGCGSPALVLSPIANARPIINTMAQAGLTNIPSSLAFVALGWSRTAVGSFPLPLALAGFGMPGCELLQSAEAAAQPVTVTGPGSATYSLPLPNWSGLIGLHIYLQGWAVAPGANAGNTIVSNGIEWGIGNS